MDRRRAAGALLALAACFACVQSAPTATEQTALDTHTADSEGCYYNFQHYGEGDRIMTNEPCLNCTCHNRMLMCYLRVCPFTKPIGQDCSIEKRADQCCPIITCPDVPVDLLTSTSTTSPAEYGETGVGRLDKYGCSINNKYYSEGSKVPSAPNKPCEHCYCIRNMTTCVMQECTLHVDGCTPIYHKDVCCPVRYSCDHTDEEPLMIDHITTTTVGTTPGFQWTTTVSPDVAQDCVHGDEIFRDGALIKTDKACEHCYCMKGDIVCVVQECGTPMENEGKNCTSVAPQEGQCCPDTYICEGDNELENKEFTTTLLPPRHPIIEGSGYRREPDMHPEGSGDNTLSTEMTDEFEISTSPDIPIRDNEPVTPVISAVDEDLKTTVTPILSDDVSTKEPDNGQNTVPVDVPEKDEVLTTEYIDLNKMTTQSSLETDATKTSADSDESSEDTHHSYEETTNVPVTSSEESLENKDDTMKQSPVTERESDRSTTEQLSESDTTTSRNILPDDHDTQFETTVPSDIESYTQKSTETHYNEETTSKDFIDSHTTDTAPKEVTKEDDIDRTTEAVKLIPEEPNRSIKEEVLLTTEDTLDIIKEIATEQPAQLPTEGADKLTTEKTIELETEIPEKQTTDEIKLTTEEAIALTTEEAINVVTEGPIKLTTEKEIKQITEETLKQTTEDDIQLTTENSIKLTTDEEVKQTAEEEEIKLATEEPIKQTTEEEIKSETEEPTKHSTEEEIKSETEEPIKLITEEPTKLTTEEEVKLSTEEAVKLSTEEEVKLSTEEEVKLSTEETIETTTQVVDKLTTEAEVKLTTENDVAVSAEEEVKSTTEEIVKLTTEEMLAQTTTNPEKITTVEVFSPDTEKFTKATTSEETITLATETKKDMHVTTYSTENVEVTTPIVQSNQEENEIVEDDTVIPTPGIIPGEGNCLVEGISYGNNSDIPKTNECQTSCKCVSSIVKCEIVQCSPPPENMINCQPVYDSIDVCCPVYVCDQPKETIPPQPHSQMAGTDSPPAADCESSECQTTEEVIVPVIKPERCTTVECKTDNQDCTDTSCKSKPVDESKIDKQDCTDTSCQSKPADESKISPTDGLTEPSKEGCESGNCQVKEEHCSGDTCITQPDSQTTSEIKPSCENSEDCPTIDKTMCEGLQCSTTTENKPESTLEEKTEIPSISVTDIKPEVTESKETSVADTTSSDNAQYTSTPIISEKYTTPTVQTDIESSESSQDIPIPTTEKLAEEATKDHGYDEQNTTPDVSISEEPTEQSVGPTDAPLNESSIKSSEQPLDELSTTSVTLTEDQSILYTSPKPLSEDTEIHTEGDSQQESTTPTERFTSDIEIPENTHSTRTDEVFTESPSGEITTHSFSTMSQEPVEQDSDDDHSKPSQDILPIDTQVTEKAPEITSTAVNQDGGELHDNNEDVTTVKDNLDITTNIPEIELANTQVDDTEIPVTNKAEEETTPSQQSSESNYETVTKETTAFSEEPNALITTPSEDKHIETESLVTKEESLTTPKYKVEDLSTVPNEIVTKTKDDDVTDHDEATKPYLELEVHDHNSEEVHTDMPIMSSVDYQETTTAKLDFSTNGSSDTEAAIIETDDHPTTFNIPDQKTTITSANISPQESDNEFTSPRTLETETELNEYQEHNPTIDHETTIKPSIDVTTLKMPELDVDAPSSTVTETENKTDLPKIDVNAIDDTTTAPHDTSEIEDVQAATSTPNQKENTEPSISENDQVSLTTDSHIIPDNSVPEAHNDKQTERSETATDFAPEIDELIPITELYPTSAKPNIDDSQPLYGQTESSTQEDLPIEDLTTRKAVPMEIKSDDTDAITSIAPEMQEDLTTVASPISPKDTEPEVATEIMAIPSTSHDQDLSEKNQEDMPSQGENEIPIDKHTTEPTIEYETSKSPAEGDIPEENFSTTAIVERVTETSKIDELNIIVSTEKDNIFTETIKEHTQGPLETEPPEMPQTTADYSIITHEEDQTQTTVNSYESLATTQSSSISSESQPIDEEQTTSKIDNNLTTETQSEDHIPTESEMITPQKATDAQEITTESGVHDIDSSTESVLVISEQQSPDLEATQQPVTEIYTDDKESTKTSVDDSDIATESPQKVDENTPSEPSVNIRIPTSSEQTENVDNENKQTSTETVTTNQDVIDTESPTDVKETTEIKLEEEISTQSIFAPTTQTAELATDAIIPDKPSPSEQISPESDITTALDEKQPSTSPTTLLMDSTEKVSENEFETPSPTSAAETTKTPQKIVTDEAKETEPVTQEVTKQPITEKPMIDDLPSPDEDSDHQTSSGTSSYNQEPEYVDEELAFGPGTCRYGGKVYVSAQQIPRDDPCDFCFCFRSDIICLQQSCPPPIHGCHEEPIQGFCCPRYECPVSMATTLNVTTTTTTTTTTLPPHFPSHAYKGAAQKRGCHIKGHSYVVGEVVRASSGPCLHCTCGGDGQMKCDPKQCTPEPMLRQMIAAAVSAKRRR